MMLWSARTRRSWEPVTPEESRPSKRAREQPRKKNCAFSSSPVESKQACIRVGTPDQGVTDNFRGDQAVSDPVPSKPENKIAARHLRDLADISETIFRFPKRSRPSVGDFELNRGEHLTETAGQPITPLSNEIVATRRVAERIVLASYQSAAIVGRSKIEIRPRGFPNEASFPPAGKFCQRLAGESISALESHHTFRQELLGFVSRGKNHVPRGDDAASIRSQSQPLGSGVVVGHRSPVEDACPAFDGLRQQGVIEPMTIELGRLRRNEG